MMPRWSTDGDLIPDGYEYNCDGDLVPTRSYYNAATMEVIYESPDGGKTVFKRDAMSLPNSRVRVDDERAKEFMKKHIEDKMWDSIREMAKTDAGMRDLLEQAVVYYKLRKE